MIIDETPLLGRIAVETATWTGSTYSWTDQTDTLISAVYDEGGRLGTPGASMVDTGTLSAVYRNMATVPSIGSLIRIKRVGTTEYAFTGYIQDIGSRVTYDFSVSTTPIVFTTLYCLDWVGLASQFQLLGIGGKTSSGAYSPDPGRHDLESRVYAMNRFIDSSGATVFVSNLSGSGGTAIAATDKIGTLSDHLDLAAISTGAYWNATHALPTNPTTGRDGLVEIYRATSSGSSGKTFTDGAGLAGELHYTEIDLESSSRNIANSLVLNNRSFYEIQNPEIVTSGGVDSRKFVEIDGQKLNGFMLQTSWKEENSSSISTYGLRQTEIETCLGVGTSKTVIQYPNLVPNPSWEYNSDGVFGTNGKLRRVKPTEEPTPFSPDSGLGEWVMRNTITTAATTAVIGCDGTLSDGIRAVAGQTYYVFAKAYRGTPARADTRARIRIQFFDDQDNGLGVTTGPQTTVPAATWVEVNTGGLVTAPSGAVRCAVSVEFSRSGGGNFSVGDRYYADGFFLWNRLILAPFIPSTTPTYFDGDTPADNTYLYFWTGSPGASPSYREPNLVDTRAVAILNQYATTSNRVTRIRWNAQEDLTSVAALRVGRSVVIKNNGNTETYRIIGISGDLSRSRYVIDYYLVKI